MEALVFFITTVLVARIGLRSGGLDNHRRIVRPAPKYQSFVLHWKAAPLQFSTHGWVMTYTPPYGRQRNG